MGYDGWENGRLSRFSMGEGGSRPAPKNQKGDSNEDNQSGENDKANLALGHRGLCHRIFGELCLAAVGKIITFDDFNDLMTTMDLRSSCIESYSASDSEEEVSDTEASDDSSDEGDEGHDEDEGF